MIAVVIPYFQREPGILRRALASIAAQKDCPLPVQVLVIDDSSPVPAEQELAGFDCPGLQVCVHRQPNGGPGAARNTGLSKLDPSTRLIAFLDSDDEWSDRHLARAVHALESGFDFYFANLFQLGQTVDGFSRAGRITPKDHPVIAGPFADLHGYRGDMFDQIMRGNVIGTSTVVFRREGFGDLRFRVDLARAGEDYLFWMSLVRRGVRIAFSSQVEATYGRGVNIYSGATWASDEYLVRVRNEITYRKATRQLFPVSAEQSKHLDRCLRELRDGFAGALVHRLRHGPGLSAGLLATHFRLDPGSLPAIPVKVAELAIGKRRVGR